MVYFIFWYIKPKLFYSNVPTTEWGYLTYFFHTHPIIFQFEALIHNFNNSIEHNWFFSYFYYVFWFFCHILWIVLTSITKDMYKYHSFSLHKDTNWHQQWNPSEYLKIYIKKNIVKKTFLMTSDFRFYSLSLTRAKCHLNQCSKMYSKYINIIKEQTNKQKISYITNDSSYYLDIKKIIQFPNSQLPNIYSLFRCCNKIKK